MDHSMEHNMHGAQPLSTARRTARLEHSMAGALAFPILLKQPHLQRAPLWVLHPAPYVVQVLHGDMDVRCGLVVGLQRA